MFQALEVRRVMMCQRPRWQDRTEGTQGGLGGESRAHLDVVRHLEHEHTVHSTELDVVTRLSEYNRDQYASELMVRASTVLTLVGKAAYSYSGRKGGGTRSARWPGAKAV